jgi:2-(1,2-epoxy-1,2-dihydrophenyl)acetyl-CoA isomerase
MHLALACDLVIMADTARFIEIFIRRGIAPDAGGAYLLARLVGPQRAKELFFFGDDVSAAEAERIGLVNRVVPSGELQKTLAEWAGRLAHAPTRAIAFTKWLVNRSLETDRTGAFWDEAYVQELVSGTDDSKEGMASFIERRDAQFKGW